MIKKGVICAAPSRRVMMTCYWDARMTGDAVVNMMSQVVRVGEELWHTAGKQFFRAYDQLR
ncbi:MAG: hypothetical protein V3V03_02315, partial [Hyphomonadaceae bacterium]